MPRLNEPYFRKQKNAWYGRINGKIQSLQVTGRENRKAAYEAFFAAYKDTEKPILELVGDAVAEFLADAEGRLSVGGMRNYRIFAKKFISAFGKYKLTSLCNADLERFARIQDDWSNTYRHQFLCFVASVCKFAVREKYVDVNPLAGLRKPPKASRGSSALVTEQQHIRMLAVCRNKKFADFLQLLWLTGARPSEIAGLTAGHIRLARGQVISLSIHKTACHGHSRMLVLCKPAWEIVERHSAGKQDCELLFTGYAGEKLTANAIHGRVTRLATKAGVGNVIPYGYRHAFATDALEKGVSETFVASLLGHNSTVMLHKHYSHLTARVESLKSQLARVRE